jgi:hypothetical protein
VIAGLRQVQSRRSPVRAGSVPKPLVSQPDRTSNSVQREATLASTAGERAGCFKAVVIGEKPK